MDKSVKNENPLAKLYYLNESPNGTPWFLHRTDSTDNFYLCNFYIIIYTVIYIMPCFAVKRIGSPCHMVTQCCRCDDYVLHSVCDRGVCRCSPGYFRNDLGTVCHQSMRTMMSRFTVCTAKQQADYLKYFSIDLRRVGYLWSVSRAYSVKSG